MKQTVISKKNSHVNKIGLFSSITILISAVIGIGIFFKNKTVLNNNDGNGYGVLISWIIAAIISLATALAFVEIISADKKHNGNGLAGWAKLICGHRVSRFILISLPLFYFLFKLVNTSFFMSESIYMTFATPHFEGNTYSVNIQQGTWQLVLVAYAVFGLFVFINAISTRAAKGISTVATIAESLPLISIGVLGLVFGGLAGWKGNFFNDGDYLPPGVHTPPLSWSDNVNIIGILASLPSILFSFDSFLAVGNAARSMKEPEKTIPKSILIGIPIVIVCYLSVTIGQMVTGSRDVYSFFLHIVDPKGTSHTASTAINVIVGCIVMLCLMGSINAFALTAIRSFGSSIEHDILMGSVKIKQLCNGKKMHEGAIYVFIAGTIVTALMAVVTIIPDSDSAYDILSSLQTLFFFGVYGLVILYGLINHYTNKVAVKKMKLFPIVAVIAITGSFLALGYNLIYVLTIQTFATNTNVNWGMFKIQDGGQMTRWLATTITWLFFIFFLVLPFINDLFIHWFRPRHNQRLIWQ